MAPNIYPEAPCWKPDNVAFAVNMTQVYANPEMRKKDFS